MSDKPCPHCNGTGRIEDRRRKVTPEQRNEIRQLRYQDGLLIAELAKRYDLTEGSISRIAPTRTNHG